MLYDVGKIDTFYNSTRGQMVARLLNKELSKIWIPSNKTSNLVVGFPSIFPERSTMFPVLMPSEIGGMPWEYENVVYSALIDSTSWPLESDSVDYVLITHALEFILDKNGFLLEASRVLRSAGKLIMIVPHRGGLWSRAETTPFGHGTPFSKRQIFALLKNTGLNPEKCTRSLFLPPFVDKLPRVFSNQVEVFGERVLPLLGGVLIVEANKLVYAEPNKNRLATKKRLFVSVKGQSAYSVEE